MSKDENEVMVKENNKVNLFEGFEEFTEFENAGFEGVDQECLQVPMIKLLQKLSPELDDNPALSAGMFYNNVTGESSNTITVIPCYFKREFLEWVPKDNGGGLVGTYQINDAIINDITRNEKGNDMLPNGNKLVDTRSHYILIVSDSGEFSFAVINFSVTSTKISKNWLAGMKMIKWDKPGGGKFTPPTFAYKYNLTVGEESNSKGKWFQTKIERTTRVDSKEIITAAKSYYQTIKNDVVKIVQEKSINDDTTNNTDNRSSDMPFD